MLLLQLLGIGIELEAALRRGPENGIPGLLAYIGLIIQYTGDGAHRIAGLGRNIFNSQDDTSSLRMETIGKLKRLHVSIACKTANHKQF